MIELPTILIPMRRRDGSGTNVAPTIRVKAVRLELLLGSPQARFDLRQGQYQNGDGVVSGIAAVEEVSASQIGSL